MNNIIAVNDNIHKITIPYKDIFTTVCTVRTDAGVMLFDSASYVGDADNYIVPMLEELEITAEDLKYVFISHDHLDHSGALGELLFHFPDVTVLSGSTHLKERFSDYKVYSPYDGETFLDVLMVVTIPGHTDESMAILDKRTNTLITGDCLQVYGIFGSQDWAANITFPVEHLEAIEKLRRMEIDEIYTAHDYYPFGTSVRGKNEVSALLDGCVEPLEKIKNLICENPLKNDAEIREIYNNSGKIPTISVRVVEAIRKAVNNGGL